MKQDILDRGNLVEGSIAKKIVMLAFPIMATSFIQMAYNMTDMMWIGRVGSEAVASVGTAGFFLWFGFAFILLSRVGTEVGVSQALGRGDRLAARNFSRNGIQLVLVLSLLYGTILLIFGEELIAFFKLGSEFLEAGALEYLFIAIFGICFVFINPVFSGIFNGSGNSLTPFWINSLGLILNLVLDPILIFGYMGFPALGIKGAAIATVISQLLVSLVFIYFIKSRFSPFKKIYFLVKPDINCMKKIINVGFPVGLQSALFTSFAMILARIITRWGALPIAVQKVGAQIEAISWMTASGFSSALSAFIGQNYGAGKWERIYKGYFITLIMGVFIGGLATYAFFFHAEVIFGWFIPEANATAMGVVYLKILALSQVFMCLEIITSGAFNGLGMTIRPAIINITLTGLRIPAALFLASTALGLDGVWWSISISSVCKGILVLGMFLYVLYKHPEINNREIISSLIFRWDNKFLRDKKSLNGKQ